MVDLHRVIDHQVAGDHGIDARGVAAHPRHRVAHRDEIHHAGHAGEILQHHPRRHEGDLARGADVPAPAGQRGDVVLGDHTPARVPERVLQEHPDRERQPVEPADTFLFQCAGAIDDGGTFGEVELGAGVERVHGR